MTKFSLFPQQAVLHQYKFIIKVMDELDNLPACEKISRFGNSVKTYKLNYDQLMLVGRKRQIVVYSRRSF